MAVIYLQYIYKAVEHFFFFEKTSKKINKRHLNSCSEEFKEEEFLQTIAGINLIQAVEGLSSSKPYRNLNE